MAQDNYQEKAILMLRGLTHQPRRLMNVRQDIGMLRAATTVAAVLVLVSALTAVASAPSHVSAAEGVEADEPAIVVVAVSNDTDGGRNDETREVYQAEQAISVADTEGTVDTPEEVIQHTAETSIYDVELKVLANGVEPVALRQSAGELELPSELAEIKPAETEPAEERAGKFLLSTDNVDPSYTGQVVNVTGSSRDTLERLVMGEAGNQGFEGAALVAQAIRDTMVLEGYSVEQVRKKYKYSGSLEFKPNQDVLDAVSYIFDQGGSAVQHRVLFFYSRNGGWHETQNFVIQYKQHRFFDRWH